MFDRIRNFFYERRRGFATAAGVAGTVYVVGKYVGERLEEMRNEAMQIQLARENLRKRFLKNQEDVVFTVMTHLSTLGSAIMSGMDVEQVTRELKARSSGASRRSVQNSSETSAENSNGQNERCSSKGNKAPGRTQSPSPPPSESSMASSVEFTANSVSPTGPHTDSSSRTADQSSAMGDSVSMLTASMSTNAQSWVDEFNSQLGNSTTGEGSGTLLELSMPGPSTRRSLPSPLSYGSGLATSVTSDSLASTNESERAHERSDSSDRDSAALASKSKAELWHEIKMLTFTRTLTIIYSTTLLSLLTTMQLNILGRVKYFQSVVQLHREERARERRALQASISALFFGLPDDEIDDVDNALEEDGVGLVTPETEMKFLTLSWWVLYVGWKDIGERVRKSVEEVFEGVSLKSRLGPMEIHRLICDVRRRVENEITYEGTERRINFLSTMIPPTPEMLALVFGEGGIPGYRPSASSYPAPMANRSEPNPETDRAFSALLDELRQTVTSPAFASVLEASLDRAMDVLVDGLRKNVFGSMDRPRDDREAEIPRLASLLPGLARWSHLALKTVPNELTDSILELRETRAFAAILYSTYSDRIA